MLNCVCAYVRSRICAFLREFISLSLLTYVRVCACFRAFFLVVVCARVRACVCVCAGERACVCDHAPFPRVFVHICAFACVGMCVCS